VNHARARSPRVADSAAWPNSSDIRNACRVLGYITRAEGDQLVVTKLDRLGRSLEHQIELSKELQSRGVDLVC
jgi:resolvase-like protein